jgi:hypothetical protein
METQTTATKPTIQATTDKTFGEVPPGHGAMAVMGKEGDTKYIWDKNNAAEVEVARSTFNSFVKDKKYLAFKVNGAGDKGEQVRDFDPTAERYIFAPMMVGG